ncbi:hypothetical protein [Lysinibacillus mangiferihumi]|uniref:hypothetical protein n=1 Tax=Lysinibacillus mangiferihumi TaxID=1130819 RepID=UPI001B85F1B1|nr:hypothetical protein [Lysinibacillus mangiferihumi]
MSRKNNSALAITSGCFTNKGTTIASILSVKSERMLVRCESYQDGQLYMLLSLDTLQRYFYVKIRKRNGG